MSTEQEKSTDQLLNEKVFPAIILVLSAVAFLLYFIEDFAGWYYSPSSKYVWMFSEYHPWSFLFLLPLAAAFGFSGFLSLMVLIKPDSKWANKFILLFYLSLGIIVVTLLAGIIYIFTVLDVEWWFGTNFYAGIVGGGFNALFAYLILRSRGEKIQFWKRD